MINSLSSKSYLLHFKILSTAIFFLHMSFQFWLWRITKLASWALSGQNITAVCPPLYVIWFVGTSVMHDESSGVAALEAAFGTYDLIISDRFFYFDIFGVIFFVTGNIFVAFTNSVVFLPLGNRRFGPKFTSLANDCGFGPSGSSEFKISVRMGSSDMSYHSSK